MRGFAAVSWASAVTVWASTALGQQPPRGPGNPPPPPSAGQLQDERGVDVSVFGLLYTGFGRVTDGASQSNWLLADAAFGGGLGASLNAWDNFGVGVELSVARTPYERRARAGNAISGAGDATVGTVLFTARLSQSGFRIPGIPGIGGVGFGSIPGFATYLSGGLGAVSYWLEDLDGGNADFAFAVGGGLEYTWSGGTVGFLEVRRLWALHEREGVETSMARHSRIELGLRRPVRR